MSGIKDLLTLLTYLAYLTYHAQVGAEMSGIKDALYEAMTELGLSREKARSLQEEIRQVT
jgi:hypothetical protein